MRSELTVQEVIHVEKVPKNYTTVAPFSATIHTVDLTVYELSLVKDAIVNVAHEIRRRREDERSDPFYYVNADYWKSKAEGADDE